MKVCFLVNQLSLEDGWGSYSVNVIRHLKKQGIDCLVLSSISSRETSLPLVRNYKVLPPLFVSRLTKLYSLIKNFKKIRQLIQKADLIHVLVEPYTPIAHWANRNKPLLITFHGTYAISHFRKWYLKKMYNRIYRKAAKLICVSRFTQGEVFKKIPLKNTLVINNGVDYQKFQKASFQKRGSTEPMIIGVGALTSRKGYHISIPAIAKVREKYRNLKYYIVGNQKDKDYFNYLRNLVARHYLENNVIFLERISDQELIKLYHQSDLFLLTSVNIGFHFEGFGLVYLEANACGKPVIGTYNCGAEDAIKDGYNGLLVPQNDIAKTAKAVLKILDDPDLAQRLGVNGIKKAKEMSWQKTIEKYIEIYKSI